jgi:hypothetical protein
MPKQYFYWFFEVETTELSFLGNINTFSTLIWQKWKMLNWFWCQIRTWKSWVICSSKIQLFELFNYLIWFDKKNVELKLKFSSDNWISFFNWVIWIDFVKMNWIENSQFGTKTQLLKHYLVCTLFFLCLHASEYCSPYISL